MGTTCFVTTQLLPPHRPLIVAAPRTLPPGCSSWPRADGRPRGRGDGARLRSAR